MSRTVLLLIVASAAVFIGLTLFARMRRERDPAAEPRSRVVPARRSRRQRLRLVVPLVAGVGYLGWAGFDLSRSGSATDADPVRTVALFSLAAVFLLVGGLEARNQWRSRG